MVALLRGPATVVPFVIFSRDGTATVGESGHIFPVEEAITVTAVVVSAGDAPAGDAIVVDVLADGVTSLWDDPGDRPRVAAGANVGVTTTFDHPAVAAGHYLTVDIVNVGSPTPGGKVDVRIEYR